MTDPFQLERFVAAQAPVWSEVVEELRNGSKSSHWMWFIFPQMRGLGFSSMAERYGISGRQEAGAYLAHPVLGARLLEATELVLAVEGKGIRRILGWIDAMKFRSSMTLFEVAASDPTVFAAALDKYYDGERDEKTLAMLGAR